MTATLDNCPPANPVEPERIRLLWDAYRFADATKLLASWQALDLPAKQLGRVRFMQAQTLFKQNRIDEFDRLCREGVVAERPNHLLARLQHALATGNLAGGGQLMTRLETEGTTASFLTAARGYWYRAEAEARHGPHALKDRILCILGTSYCGSTFLASLLGSLPGCANVGESYRMISSSQTNDFGYHDQAFAFGKDAPDKIEPCLACGRECELYDFDFRAYLATQPPHWYETILEKSGAERLIATDKTKTRHFAPMQQHRYIVLFKSPANAYMSAYQRSSHLARKADKAAHAATYLRAYCQAYEEFSHNKALKDRALFMSWEHFTRAPEQHLTRVGAHAELDVDPGILTARQGTQHCFGGNADLNRRLEASPEQSSIRPLMRPHRAVLQECGYQDTLPRDWAERVHAGLIRRYRAQLSMPATD